jgi:hypothetical protein
VLGHVGMAAVLIMTGSLRLVVTTGVLIQT